MSRYAVEKSETVDGQDLSWCVYDQIEQRVVGLFGSAALAEKAIREYVGIVWPV